MRKRVVIIVAGVAIIVAACGRATPSSAPPAASGASSAPSTVPTASAAAAEQTLDYAIDGDISGGLTNAAANVATQQANTFLYDALYRYDASLTPQPALATKLADVSSDGTVWTVTLRQGVKFHDGSDVTADDVVQSFALAQSSNCTYRPAACLASFLASVEKVDDSTVKFTLKQALSTFATVYLPAILIESKDAVDASYARYLEATKAVSAAELTAFLSRVDAEVKTSTGPPAEGDTKPTINYAQFSAEAEELLTKAGQPLADKGIYTAEGVLDANGYTRDNIGRIRAIQMTTTAGAIDALAAAYKFLDIQLNPVGLGTGPFKFVSYTSGDVIEYVNNPDYYNGASAIQKVFLPIIKDDIAGGRALAAGQIDWMYSIEGGTYNEIKSDPDLKFVEYPDLGFFALYFNLHDGALFTDKNLRQAVSYCFDKEATANVATDGQGVAIYSEIPSTSWAYPTEGLNKYPRDVAKAKSLIEQSGWTLGSDGVYEKAGVKLSSVTAVRAGRANRSKWMRLMSDQVKECGIDITFKEVDFGAVLKMLTIYPHINAAAPQTSKPFDTYFGGFLTSYEPDPFSLYHSNECSSAERPDTNNYICYRNAEVDRLIETGLTTFDQTERAKIYQQYAVIQSNELPVIYAWSDIQHEGLRKTVDTMTAGGLLFDTPEFFELEQLTNIKAAN